MAGSTRRTAISASASRPTTVAGVLDPSWKVTVAPAPSPTTWSLVSTWPAVEITKPEPSVDPAGPPDRMVTTLGNTRSTTCARLPGAGCAAGPGSEPTAPSIVPTPPLLA